MVDLGALTFPLALHIGVLVAMTLFVTALLGYEVDLPAVIGLPLSFFVSLFGYIVAWSVHFVADLSMLYALTGMVLTLAFAAWLYDEAA